MSKLDKLPPKKRLTKISVESTFKNTEFKLASSLLAKNGFEVLTDELDKLDIFEALAQLIYNDKKRGPDLRQLCLLTLQKWTDSSNIPSNFNYLSKMKPFIDFYSHFPACIFFEGVF